jgi:hypothetical protein
MWWSLPLFVCLLRACRRKWQAILGDDFTMRMPVTIYRYFPSTDMVDNHRIVQGVDGMVRALMPPDDTFETSSIFLQN